MLLISWISVHKAHRVVLPHQPARAAEVVERAEEPVGAQVAAARRRVRIEVRLRASRGRRDRLRMRNWGCGLSC